MAQDITTVKINELATSAINSSDYFVKADQNGIAYKNTLSALANFISTVGAVAYGGSLAIDDTPTEDGFYFASESGTYTNAGGLVVDLANGINIISVTEGQTVFELVVIPVDLSSQLANEVESTSTDKAVTGRAVSLESLPDIYQDKSVISSSVEWSMIEGLVDFWVDDPSQVTGLEFRVRGVYINDSTYSDRFGLKEVTENVNIWSQNFYGEMTWGDSGYKYVTIPYKGTILNFVWDVSKLTTVGTDDSLNHVLDMNNEPVTAIGADAQNKLLDNYNRKIFTNYEGFKDRLVESHFLLPVVDFWVDDIDLLSGKEFRFRAFYRGDSTYSDRFGLKELVSGDIIWSHNTYPNLDWDDEQVMSYFRIPYEGTFLNIVINTEKVTQLGINDDLQNVVLLNEAPSTPEGCYSADSDTENLVIATLGDSITMNFSSNIPDIPAVCGDHDNQDWPTLKQKLRLSEVINIGIGGARWQDRGDENITDCPLRGTDTGTASNCIRMLKRLINDNNRPTPDIITFAFGTNNPTPDGDYETVMNMTFSELENDEVYRQTMYGGIRYSLEVVTRDFPDAQIVLLCPMQSNTSSRPIEDLKKVGDIIKEMGRRYSCTVIDLYGELGVVDKYENDGSNGRYLSDGVHLNGKGKKLYTDFLAKKLKEIIVKRP